MPLSLTDLGHRFGSGSWLFRHLNIEVTPGEVVALVGPSGSGKSTLLAIVSGQLSPAEGEVRGAGATTRWVFQNPHGVAQRSALDHVTLPLLASGWAAAEAAQEGRELLRRLGIEGIADVPFARLSGGEAQRLMLARAMAAGPALLLVDEPTAQLDQPTAQVVAASLQVLAQRGTIVLIATHDPSVVANCGRVIDLTGYPG